MNPIADFRKILKYVSKSDWGVLSSEYGNGVFQVTLPYDPVTSRQAANDVRFIAHASPQNIKFLLDTIDLCEDMVNETENECRKLIRENKRLMGLLEKCDDCGITLAHHNRDRGDQPLWHPGFSECSEWKESGEYLD